MNNKKFIKAKLDGMDYHEFYNIAVYFLDTQGYKDISIVDGANDKGTDVITSSSNTQIQLTVNKKWKEKINSELENTLNNQKHTLLYITNQRISPEDVSDFKKSIQKYKDKITLIIHDLDCIATTLSLPKFLKRSYELLKIEQPISIEATQEDIAISNILLLSKEAIDLRENILETRILTCIYMKVCKNTKESIVSYLVHEGFEKRMIERSFSKLLQEQKIIKNGENIKLSDSQLEIFDATKFQYELEIKEDKDNLVEKLGVSNSVAEEIIKLGLEISAKLKDTNIDNRLLQINQVDLNLLIVNLEDLISRNGLNHNKKKIYELISGLNITKIQQYKNTLQYITQTTTYDIYRILSKNTRIKIILDTSVAMPMLFALEMGINNSKLIKAAKYLLELSKKHNFELIVPAPYINEIAGHGFKICDIDRYEEIITTDVIDYLRESKNAFISAYANLSSKEKEKITMVGFLEHFGIHLEKRNINSFQEKARNTIHDLLVGNGINVIQLNHNLNNEESFNALESLVEEKKQSEPDYHRADSLIKNDADVCTYLKAQTDSGYIFATWDSIIPKALQSLSRIYANTPPKVMDLLCFCHNLDYSINLEMYTTLIFSDENKLAKLAEKIESVKSVDEFVKKVTLTREIRNHRTVNDIDWVEDKEVIDGVLNIWE